MTLRTRLLISFIFLGAVPLMLVGWATNQRNLRAVEDLVGAETRLVAERVSEEIGVRYDILRGELLFLADNVETRRLFGETSLPSFAYASGGPETFLQQELERMAGRFQELQFRDAEGRLVYPQPTGGREIRVGEGQGQEGLDPEGEASQPVESNAGRLFFSEDIVSSATDRMLGSVSAVVEPAMVLPGNLPERGFGEEGFIALVDTRRGRILYHPQRSILSQPLTELLPIPTQEIDAVSGDVGALRYSLEDQLWVGFLSPIRDTSWAVLASSPLQGFSAPFQSAARANLLLVFTITLLAAGAFLMSTLRTTRSLVELTTAAKQVASADLDPNLPPPGRDEVGTLSGTFRTMLERIRTMIRQVEENRQMAAVGEFSAQIAHELRNPLTAIRMSLQGLKRKLGGTEHARPLEIALLETSRLDRVAGGVLSLGRKTQGEVKTVSALELVKESVRAVASELEERGVETTVSGEVSTAEIEVDQEAIKGALINLLRNAMEAMPGGGSILISLALEEKGWVGIHVRDGGPGIPPGLSEKIFDPFVTTKDQGNGFGLPLALRAVEANGGRLQLEESTGSTDLREEGESKGAHFVLELPIVPSTSTESQRGDS